MTDSALTATAIVAFTTFFATIAPLDCAVIFAALTAEVPEAQRRALAIKSSMIAAIIMFIFALIGQQLLATLGISLAALRTSGGILLLLIGIDMVFARASSMSATSAEKTDVENKQDISVFPLATPLIAGPGAMGVAILLMANAHGHFLQQVAVIIPMLLVLLITMGALLAATRIERLLGLTGMQVISRIFGVLLSALAVQFIFDGIAQSGILGHAT